MATISRQSRADVGVNILAEITAGLWCKGMVLTSGKTVTYELSTSLEITAVKQDGTALTSRSSVNDVESNPGSYYHNGTTLYVSATTGDVYDKTIVAEVIFRFSKDYKIFNNTPYESRINRAPNLSLRIEKDFGGTQQIGGGDLQLANHDGYFDALESLQWDYGAATIKMGFDLRTGDESYADYTTVGTWRIESWAAGDAFFTLQLAEIKSKLTRKIPIEEYDRGQFPQIHESWIGKPIPRAYGRIYGATPALVNASTGTFKVAGHAIRSLDTVRLKIDDVWVEKSFASKDLANATFTVTDWADGIECSVDFEGRKNSDGELMVNYADVVEDLLEYIGETDINSTELAATRNRLKIGLDRFGKEVHARAVSLLIDERDEMHHFIRELNRTVGGYLYSDANGQYHIGIFEPVPGDDLNVLTERDYDKFEPIAEADEITSKVIATYNSRQSGDWREKRTFESDATRYAHGESSHLVDDYSPKLSELRDIEYYGQRLLRMKENSRRTWKVTTFWNAFGWLPGQFVRVTYDRRSMNRIMEILEVNTNLMTGQVTLLLGCLRNYSGGSGFIVADADVLPTDFAQESGYGSGSLAWNASWSSTIKTWVKQNVAYITDANGFASSTDAQSFLASRII